MASANRKIGRVEVRTHPNGGYQLVPHFLGTAGREGITPGSSFPLPNRFTTLAEARAYAVAMYGVRQADVWVEKR